MSKKQKKAETINLGWTTLSDSTKLIIGLSLVLCFVTLFVVLKLQGEIEHNAVQQRIDILKEVSDRK